MGQRDFHPLSANFLLSKWLPSHWENYAKGKALVGQTAERKDWRIARSIFVADDDKTAAAYAGTDATAGSLLHSQLHAAHAQQTPVRGQE